MKHIGVVSHARLPDLSSGLKRYALFFDEIQIVGIGPDNLAKMHRFIDAQSIGELEYLYDAGLLAEGRISARSLSGLTDETRIPYVENAFRLAIAETQLERSSSISDAMNLLLEAMALYQKGSEEQAQLIEAYNTLAKAAAESLVTGTYALPLSARQVALDLCIFGNQQAVCIEELDYSSAGDNPDRRADKDVVYEIAVLGLPIPERTPWQDILEFKKDPKAQQRLLAFHVWASEFANGKISYAEARDRIEFLKQEFVDAMKQANWEWRPGILKCVVVAAAALASLNFKEAAENLFKITEGRAKLLAAERQAPGRELAYLVRAGEILR